MLREETGERVQLATAHSLGQLDRKRLVVLQLHGSTLPAQAADSHVLGARD